MIKSGDYTEDQLIKLSARLKIQLDEEEKQYFAEKVMSKNASYYAKCLIAGDTINPKKDVKEELKHALLNKKFDKFIADNNIQYHAKTNTYIKF